MPCVVRPRYTTPGASDYASHCTDGGRRLCAAIMSSVGSEKILVGETLFRHTVSDITHHGAI